MKSFFLSIIFLFAINLNAQVLKPIATYKPLNAVLNLYGVNFNYKVTDLGWITSGKIFPEPTNFNSSKTYFLDYDSEVLSENMQQHKSLIQSFITTDADIKCAELGSIDFQEQIKNLDASYQTSFNAKIVKTSSTTIYPSDKSVGLSLLCNITIIVLK